MSNFAERIKAVSSEVKYRNEHPDINQWRENQRKIVKENIEGYVIKEFERWAAKGVLRPCCVTQWGEEARYVPNATKITREILEEIFTPYGINVKDVSIELNSQINATFIIE